MSEPLKTELRVYPQKRNPTGEDGYHVEVRGGLSFWAEGHRLQTRFPKIDLRTKKWQEV